MVTSVIAGEPFQSRPPKQYQLEDIRISVLYQTGHRLPGSYEIQIRGDGKATKVVDQKQKTELTLDKKSLLELLNEFYSIHFFELQGTYTSKQKVSLLDNNLVSTFSHRIIDMDSFNVCVKLADYEKCVTIMNKQPLEAYRLVKKIESLRFKATNS